MTNTGNVRWRSVVMPTEHGSWGIISVPIVLGLLLAPTWGGLMLSLAAFAAFLLRQPLKLWLKDMRLNRRAPRTAVAARFALIFGGIVLVAGVIALILAPSFEVFLPLLAAVPLVGVQLVYDVRGKSRSLVAELCGSVATGAIISSIVLMAGWEMLAALALWVALAVKVVTAVLYVRARLRLERDKPASVAWVLVAHAVGLLILLALVLRGWLPVTVLIAMAVLGGRAAIGLSPLRKPRPPKIIGMMELAYSAIFIVLVVIGYHLA